MEIFIWMYVALFLIWGLSASMSKQLGRKFSCISSFLILWLIQALRSTSTGTDLRAYIPFFHQSAYSTLGEITHTTNMEWGYQIYNELISHYISTDPSVFLAITAFIAIAPIAIIIYKYSASPSLSFIIFASFVVYMFDFSGLRQAMAIGITSLSFIFVERRKLIPFIIIVLLASTIHTSAILFMMAYPLCNYLNMTPKKYLLAGVIAIGVLLSLHSVAMYFIELLFGGEKYIGYISKETSGAYMLLLLLTLLFLFTFFKNEKFNNRLRILIFTGALFQSLGLISDTATRMGYYFYIFLCLALPETLDGYRLANNQLFLKLGLAAFMIFFFFYTTGEGTMGVVPYHFFWEQ